MFVKQGYPRRQQSQNMAKISESYILTPLPNPQRHVMSVEYEEPIDELTVWVWLLYDHQNFEYCTLLVSGMELWTNRQTDGRTDDPNTRCPQPTFQAGGIKSHFSARMIFRQHKQDVFIKYCCSLGATVQHLTPTHYCH